MNDLYIMHYGVGHDKGGHSGRYPWGSGKNPYGGTQRITNKEAKKFNKKYSKYFISESKRIENSKEKKDFEYAITQYIKNIQQNTGVSYQQFAKWFNEDESLRKDVISELMDDRSRIPSLNKKIKDIVHDYRVLFNESNSGQRKIIEDFLKKYDGRTLYDLPKNYAEYDLNGTIKKFGKDYVEVAKIIRNAYDKDIGALDDKSKYYSEDDSEWLEQFLKGAL